MSDPVHDKHVEELVEGGVHGSHVGTYIRVFIALTVFTALEYFFARIFKDAFATLLAGLLVIAIIKAAMVGMYFMHLKFEGRWVYMMLIPAGILAMVLVLALYPDMAMQPIIGDDSDPDEVAGAPAEPAVANKAAAGS